MKIVSKARPSDSVASDYTPSLRNQRRLQDAVAAEMLRVENENRAAQRLRSEVGALTNTDTLASCTCGWVAFGTNAVLVADRATVHALVHTDLKHQGVSLGSRVEPSGKENRVGTLSLQESSNPSRARSLEKKEGH